MPLHGEFIPPGDKSISHRLVLISLLAEGEMIVNGLAEGDDVKTSLRIFQSLGGEARGGGNQMTLKGLDGKLRIDILKPVDLDCGNSGTTARLLAGAVAALPGFYIFDGDELLRRRPMERLVEPLRQMGACIETTSGNLPVTIIGGNSLHGIEFINQEGSAQLKGAVTLATLNATSPSYIIEPVPTRDHTEKIVNICGGQVLIHGSTLKVYPGQLTLPAEIYVPGDPSSAAFFLTGAALITDSIVTAKNMLLSGARIGFLRVLDRMGASVSISLEQEKPEPCGKVTVAYNGQLIATEVTSEEVPSLIDEVPILALAAALAKGTTIFRNMRELRFKEIDRLTGICYQLGALGVQVKIESDDLFVTGPTKLISPEILDSGHDHRLAMTLLMARFITGSNTPVRGEESISISYPSFKEELIRLNV
ncbi:MAG: hypothetical protein AMR96_04170 [Candidatus Adiutrix intracellularis]|nr:MAG: hypothetical protein AMR96_04170 [Candidatus Adiutrix intracellularis]